MKIQIVIFIFVDSNEKSLKSSNNVAKDIVKVKSPVPTKEKKVSKTYTKKSQPSITKEGTNHAAIRQSAVDSFYKALSTCEEGKTYPDSSLRDIAKSIEASLFEAYPLELDPYGKDPKSAGGISLQYKSKFRSLLFNIKDNRNTNLRLRILSVPSGAAIENSEARYLHLSPKDLVRMNSEDLAPPSLRQEIEQTRQVTLEHQILDEEQLELVLGGIRRKSSITKPTIVEGPLSMGPALPMSKTDELAHTIFPESPGSSSANEKISSPTIQSSLGLLDNMPPQDYSPESILKLLSTPSRYALPPKRKSSLNATSKNTGPSDSINNNPSTDAHTNNIGLISEPFSDSQNGPVWQGLIFMPELCVSFHRAISSTIFEEKFPSLSEFNLPIFLTVQGRMDSKKADTYLKQVFESPHRKLLVCPLQIQVANQAISESEEVHINNLVKSHEKFLKGTKLDKDDKLRSDLKARDRYGVILSNHHKIFVGAKVTDWLIKDLYLLPTLASIPFLGKRKYLDAMSDAMFLVAVLSPALPLKKESPQNTFYSEAALNNDSFQYKPLTNIVPPHVYYPPIVPQSYPGPSLLYSEPNSAYSMPPSNPSAEDILSQLDSLANQ